MPRSASFVAVAALAAGLAGAPLVAAATPDAGPPAAAPARAALGIGLAGDRGGGAVDGPVIASLVPGGAAAGAGLAVGDTLLTVNNDPLAAASAAAANEKLVRFMAGVNPGEELTVRYRRGTAAPAVVKLTAMPGPVAFTRAVPGTGQCPMHPPGGALAHHPGPGRDRGPGAGPRLADLTPALGRYFGAESGVLVLRAPVDDAFGLVDGDVIRSIGGRTPKDHRHARRILASYAPGETVRIEVLRDRKPRRLEATLPAAD